VKEVRRATAADAAAIAAVHVAGWHETYTGLLPEAIIAEKTDERRRRAQWEPVLREGTRDVFVATENDRIVGFICGGAMPAEIRGRAPIPGHDAYVDALYVLAAAHGRGLGRALLGSLALRLREHGFRAPALHVLAANPAVRFYEHLGAAFIHAEPVAEGAGAGLQCAYGWRDIRDVPTGTPGGRFNLAAVNPHAQDGFVDVLLARRTSSTACTNTSGFSIWR
jgi:ribosomal protein S18 acetylase RimI-like enzyme